MEKQRYAIIGAGALGGLYGGMLANSRFEVHFLVHRVNAHLTQHGLRVESPLGDFHLPNVNVYATPESMPSCEVTIAGLKTTRQKNATT
jgi:2-dehydropantoate 2-reductase